MGAPCFNTGMWTRSGSTGGDQFGLLPGRRESAGIDNLRWDGCTRRPGFTSKYVLHLKAMALAKLRLNRFSSQVCRHTRWRPQSADSFGPADSFWLFRDKVANRGMLNFWNLRRSSSDLYSILFLRVTKQY